MESAISALKDREINGELELEILNSIQYFSQNTSGLDVNDASNNNGMDTSGKGRTYDIMARTSQGKSFIIFSSSLASNVSSPLSSTFYEKRRMINQDNDEDVNDEKDNDHDEEKERNNHTLKQKFNEKESKVKHGNGDVNDVENINKNENSSISGYDFDADCFDLTRALSGLRKPEFQDRIERVGEREWETERMREGETERERERVGEGEKEGVEEKMRECEGEWKGKGGENMIIENIIENRIDSSIMIDENRMFSVSRNILPSNVHVIHTHDARIAYISSGSTYTTQSDPNLDKNIEVNNDDCENEQNSTANKLNLDLKLKLSGFSSPSSSDETSIGKFSPSRFSDFSSDLECLSKKLDALSHINISGLRTSNS